MNDYGNFRNSSNLVRWKYCNLNNQRMNNSLWRKLLSFILLFFVTFSCLATEKEMGDTILNPKRSFKVGDFVKARVTKRGIAKVVLFAKGSHKVAKDEKWWLCYDFDMTVTEVSQSSLPVKFDVIANEFRFGKTELLAQDILPDGSSFEVVFEDEEYVLNGVELDKKLEEKLFDAFLHLNVKVPYHKILNLPRSIEKHKIEFWNVDSNLIMNSFKKEEPSRIYKFVEGTVRNRGLFNSGKAGYERISADYKLHNITHGEKAPLNLINKIYWQFPVEGERDEFEGFFRRVNMYGEIKIKAKPLDKVKTFVEYVADVQYIYDKRYDGENKARSFWESTSKENP